MLHSNNRVYYYIVILKQILVNHKKNILSLIYTFVTQFLLARTLANDKSLNTSLTICLYVHCDGIIYQWSAIRWVMPTCIDLLWFMLIVHCDLCHFIIIILTCDILIQSKIATRYRNKIQANIILYNTTTVKYNVHCFIHLLPSLITIC
jgi:hypothetical protein